MFASSISLVFLIGLISVCAEDLDEDFKLPSDTLVGPDGEKFNDGEVVDCEFIEDQKQQDFILNRTAYCLYQGSIKMQPLCNPATKSVRDYYKNYSSVNNFPSPFTSSLTEDPLTGSEFHFFVKDAVNKSTITFMSFDETRANFTDIPLVITIYPHENRLRFNTRKDKQWCIPQDVSHNFSKQYWLILQLTKCGGKQCFRVYVGEKRNNIKLIYTAYLRTILKKFDYWSVKMYNGAVLEAAFWRKKSQNRNSITIVRDGLSREQPIMVRGRVEESEIKVKFTFKDGTHKDVTVETKKTGEVETLFFEISDEGVLQSYKTEGEKTNYPGVEVKGAIKFEVLSGMKVRAIEVEQCAGEYKKN